MAEATQVALDDSRRLGVKPDQVNELVDFYHAVEHLGKIAALQHHWTAAERQAWIGRQRRRLRKGGAEESRINPSRVHVRGSSPTISFISL